MLHKTSAAEKNEHFIQKCILLAMRRIKVFVVVLVCVILVVSLHQTTINSKKQNSGYADMLYLETPLYSWEDNITDPQICKVTNFTSSLAFACLNNKYRELGRKWNLVVMGDSRGRIMYSALKDLMKAKDRIRKPGGICLKERNYTNLLTGKRYMQCHLGADNDLLSLDFRWWPILNDDGLGEMEELFTECRHGPCIDLVVTVVGTPHNALVKKNSLFADTVLLDYGENLQLLLDIFKRLLDTGTRIIWKADDPINTRDWERGKGNIEVGSFFSPKMLLLTSLTQMILTKDKRVQLWTSSMPVGNNWKARCVGHSNELHCMDDIHIDAVAQAEDINLLMNALCHNAININNIP